MPALPDSTDHQDMASSELAAFAPLIHPERLASGLDPSLSPATLTRLQSSSRMQERVARLMLGDAVAAGPDLLLGQAPRRAALLAGGIWHARSLLKLISGADLAVFVDKVGAEVQPFGVRQIGLAVSTAVIADPTRLAEAVEQDGHGCLGAWLETIPEQERRRVLLRLPPGTAAEKPASAHRIIAEAIFAVVLAHLADAQP